MVEMINGFGVNFELLLNVNKSESHLSSKVITI